MKIQLFLLLLSFCFCTIVNGQYQGFEDEVDRLYFAEEGKSSFDGELSGLCDFTVIATDQFAGIEWDYCGVEYSGVLELVHEGDNMYSIITTSPNNETFNDPSFGAYYGCYNVNTQEDMPNEDADNPTLFFQRFEDGQLGFTGTSQWGEIYSISDVETNGNVLEFNWTNDYGEGAQVTLTREDEQSWESLLAAPVCAVMNESDSLALVAVYNATDGENWHIPWDLTEPVESWYGVTLNDQCEIVELDLGISAELFQMDIQTGNNLIGSIPKELFTITSLVELVLSANELSGDIAGIEDLINLETLRLFSNQLSGQIPEDISNMSKLTFCSFSDNQFEGELPSQFPENIEVIFASRNQLEGGVPASFDDLANLRSCSLWGNNLGGTLPENLGDINTLTYLDLSFNNFEGSIPSSYAQKGFWNRLLLSYNQIDGEIPDGFISVNDLRLDNNQLTGEIPPSLASESPVLILQLMRNKLSGAIPDNLFEEGANQSLHLYDNDFEKCLSSIDEMCTRDFNNELDTFEVAGQQIIGYYGDGYNFTGNPKLPWEGNLQRACDDIPQIGAPCDDSNPDTMNDGIDEDCNCTENSVSTSEIGSIEELMITPNPIQAGESLMLNFRTNEPINLKIRLLDMTGQAVLTQNSMVRQGDNSVSVETVDIPAGLYVVQLASDDGVTSRKVVVQH